MDLFSSDRPKTVLLDTNILMYSASRPFDIEHMLNKRGITDIRVPSFVKSELECLSKGRGAKEGKFAKLALQIASAFNLFETDTRGRTVDDKLVNLAQDGSYIVATADAPLRRRLTNLDIEVIYLKDGRLITD